MNLIRNGGFESGTTDHWEMTEGTLFTVDDSDPKYGSYCGELVANANVAGSLYASDYIEVSPFELFNLSCQIKNSLVGTFRLYIEEYTQGLDFIGYNLLYSGATPTVWTLYELQARLKREVSYIRLRCYLYLNVTAQTFKVDNAVLSRFSADLTPIRVYELASVNNATSSGDTSDEARCMYGYNEYYAEIDVTSITGTSPTCDVTICEEDQYGNERVLGTFTQFNATTDQRVGIAAPIGEGMYVKYVMGGTVTDCDFEVSVIGVR